MTIISTTVGKNALRNGAALIEKKKKRKRKTNQTTKKNSLKCSTWMKPQKWQNYLSLFPRQTIDYHNNPSLCPNHCPKEAEGEQCYEYLQDLLELLKTPKKKKKRPFHHEGLKSKSRKSKDTWSNRQVWSWSTKWSRVKANEFCQKNALVIANTSSNNIRDDSTHGHHQMVNTEIRLIMSFAADDGEAPHSQQKQDLALIVTDHELLTATFRFKLKKVQKTPRPFR